MCQKFRFDLLQQGVQSRELLDYVNINLITISLLFDTAKVT